MSITWEGFWFLHSVLLNASGSFLIFSAIFSSPWPISLATVTWTVCFRRIFYEPKHIMEPSMIWLGVVAVSLLQSLFSYWNKRWALTVTIGLNSVPLIVSYFVVSIARLYAPDPTLVELNPPFSKLLNMIIFAAYNAQLVSFIWSLKLDVEDDSARLRYRMLLVSFGSYFLWHGGVFFWYHRCLALAAPRRQIRTSLADEIAGVSSLTAVVRRRREGL